MDYKALGVGDIKQKGDQYLPTFSNGIWVNVLLIGQPVSVMEYRLSKFRRPIPVITGLATDEQPETT